MKTNVESFNNFNFIQKKKKKMSISTLIQVSVRAMSINTESTSILENNIWCISGQAKKTTREIHLLLAIWLS